MNCCKYWDCGWCYAPDDVETSASSQSACVDPDYCPYLKSQMTEMYGGNTPIVPNETIEEWRLEEKLRRATEKVMNSNKQTLPDIIEIDGAKYQKVEEPLPAKDKVPLYKRFYQKGTYGWLGSDDALKVVREFLLDEGVIECEDAEYVTIKLQKSLLKSPNDNLPYFVGN